MKWAIFDFYSEKNFTTSKIAIVINPSRGGGGRIMPPYRFFACPDKKFIDNVAFYVLTFSFIVYGRF